MIGREVPMPVWLWVVGCAHPGPLFVADLDVVPDGGEIFERTWVPYDLHTRGGDGLGPLYNDSSCVACHGQGGVGGSGDAEHNALIVPRKGVLPRYATDESARPPWQVTALRPVFRTRLVARN